MRIFITGGTGLIGRRFVADRRGRGDQLIVLSRSAAAARRRLDAGNDDSISIVEGDPTRAGAWQRSISGCDAVVNLAGAGIADRRWTSAYKKLLIDSRVDSTANVVEAIADADDPPATLLSASAVGYYGDTADRIVDESAEPGDDFLAGLARQWEQAASRAASARTRVVLLRIGNVLDTRGGMLEKLLTPFRLGVGGPWGSGRQYMPFVHVQDLVRLMGTLLSAEADGPFNGVAPEPVTVDQFAGTLGRVLRRPAFLPAPTGLLRIVFGELADAMAMSCRVVSGRFDSIGFEHEFGELEFALRSLLDPQHATVSAE